MGHRSQTGSRHFLFSAQFNDGVGRYSVGRKPGFSEKLQCLKESSTASPKEGQGKCDSCVAGAPLFTEGLERAKASQGDSFTVRRAKTAMAALGDEDQWDPYETTTKREFQYKPGPATNAKRATPGQTASRLQTPKPAAPHLENSVSPQSSLGYTYPYQLNEPIGNNTYQEEFYWKQYSKPKSIRTGTSSGARRNNPHPNQSFMVWKLPREEKEISPESKSPWRMPLLEEDVWTAIAAQYRSIYKEDYLGIPQGFQVKYAIPAPPNWKEKIPRPPLTEFRYHYCLPKQNPDLMLSMARFGSNAHRDLPAKGIVPTVTFAHIKNQEKRRQQTTYQTHFEKGHLDLVKVLNSRKEEDISKYLQSVPEQDRAVLQNFFNTVAVGCGTKAADKSVLGVLSETPAARERTSVHQGPFK